MPIDLAGLCDGAHEPGTQSKLAEAAALRLVEALDEIGYVSALRYGRIGVVTASDGPYLVTALSTVLLAAMARPIEIGGAMLAPGATLSTATCGADGATAEELFVAADKRIAASRGLAQRSAIDGQAIEPENPSSNDGLRFFGAPRRKRA